jgi:hypothetical protein
VRQKIFVTLEPREADALLTLAVREDRDPRRQAARLLREGLARRGLVADLELRASGTHDPDDSPPAAA